MHVLLVEPDYYSRYPPLGLLKLASYHRAKGDTVELVRAPAKPTQRPDLVYITSLFTYAWKPVHAAVHAYRLLFPQAEIRLGGIYASLLPEHARLSGADQVHVGLVPQAESFMPAYDLVPEWKSTILFASRGCIRRCGFCSVPKLEGRPSDLRYELEKYIYPGHEKVILWDNNILGNPNWKPLFRDIIRLGVEVDFNQGLDARLLTDEVAEYISHMRMSSIRLAYDYIGIRPAVNAAIGRLRNYGISVRKVIVYTLFDYVDDPENFFQRVRDLLNWGAVSYPMRFEPLTSLVKNRFVSPHWTPEALTLVAKARRVLGFAGAFPPYRGLIDKLNSAESFDDAFSLRPVQIERQGLPQNTLSEISEETLVPITYHGSGRLRKVKDWRKMLA